MQKQTTIEHGPGAVWLARLRAINATDAEGARQSLQKILVALAEKDIPTPSQLEILEEMRGMLDFVLGQTAQRYASRPLPPSSAEETLLRETTHLWQAVETAYARLSHAVAGQPGWQNKAALLAHRRVHYAGMQLIECFRARRELPQTAWRKLHELFATLCECAPVAERAPDALNETWGAQSAEEAYIALLLIDAANPYCRTPRELTWLVRWAQRFAPYCRFAEEVLPDGKSVYGLDVLSDFGLRPVNLAAPGVPLRYLDTRKLAAHIHSVVLQLRKGVAAASLGLGEDCVQPACARLLVSLYRPWGLAAAGRKFARRALTGDVALYHDPMAAAYFIQGKEFSPPMDVRRSNFTDTQALRLFGEQAEAAEGGEHLEARALQLGYVQEVWDVVDQSAAGYRLMRLRGDSRIEHKQLLGVRSRQMDSVALAEVSWLQYRQQGSLVAGINLMPGPPEVVPVRLVIHERVARERHRLGFLIPAVPAVKTEETLILPAGWFLADRRVEVYKEEAPWVAKLVKLVSRGINFDRVQFVRE